MPVYTADLVISLFFLFSLVMVASLRRQIVEEDRQSYCYIASGLVVLAFLWIGRMLRDGGLFTGVPFLSDSLFFDLINGILVITGGVFLVSGVASWVPLARHHRRVNRDKVRRLQLIRNVEQLTRVQSQIDVVLKTVLKHMIDRFALDSGAVYRLSQRGCVLALTSTSGMGRRMRSRLMRLQFDIEGWQRFQRSGERDASGFFTSCGGAGIAPRLVLPMIVNDRPVGFYILWEQGGEGISREDEICLRSAVEIVSREIDRSRLQHKTEFDVRANRLQASLVSVLSSSSALKDNLRSVLDVLRTELPDIDYLTVTGAGDGGQQRITVGPAETLLVEKVTKDVWEEAPPWLRVEDVHRIASGAEATAATRPLFGMLPRTGAKVHLLLPLLGSNSLLGVVVAGSLDFNALSGMEQRLFHRVRVVFRQMIQLDLAQSRSHRQVGRLDRVRDFIGELSRQTTTTEACRMVARQLADEYGAQAARISLLDSGGNFLDSQAAVLPSSPETTTPVYGSLILSLAPAHAEVIRSGRSTHCSRGGAEHSLSEMEARHAFTSATTEAILLPIISGGKTVGVVGLGFSDERKPGALVASLVPAECYARVLGLYLSRRIESEVAGKVGDRGRSVRADVSEARVAVTSEAESTAETSRLSGRIISPQSEYILG